MSLEFLLTQNAPSRENPILQHFLTHLLASHAHRWDLAFLGYETISFELSPPHKSKVTISFTKVNRTKQRIDLKLNIFLVNKLVYDELRKVTVQLSMRRTRFQNQVVWKMPRQETRWIEYCPTTTLCKVREVDNLNICRLRNREINVECIDAWNLENQPACFYYHKVGILLDKQILAISITPIVDADVIITLMYTFSNSVFISLDVDVDHR